MTINEKEKWIGVNVRRPVFQALKILTAHLGYETYNELIINLLKTQKLDDDPDILNVIKKLLLELEQQEGPEK
jgi:hypothetical protein